MRRLGPVRLLLRHEPERDGHGDPLPGTVPPPFEVEGCAVYPAGTTEGEGTASTVTELLTALLPIDRSRVNSQMTVIYDGDEYRVKGKPARWTFMAGGEAATMLTLKEATNP